MKRIISVLVCATLVVSGGMAYQKAQTADGPTAKEKPRLQFANKVQSKGNQLIISGGEGHFPAVRVQENAAVSSNETVEPVEAPFVSEFEAEDALYEDWNVINANEDSYTWCYYYFLAKDRSVAIVDYNPYKPTDDYLVTKAPVSLDAGDAYFSFDYGGIDSYSYYPESLEVLWGTTPDVEQMEKLAEYVNFKGDEFTAQIPFDVPTDGNYYFAIHGISEANQYGVWVDNVEINNGAYVQAPNILVRRVILPASSFSLSSSEKVSVEVVNNGAVEITSFALSVNVAVNGSQQQCPLQTVAEALPVGESSIIEIESGVSMEEAGVYNVTVSASEVKAAVGTRDEVFLADNSFVGSTTHFGVSDVPVDADFTTGAHSDKWACGGDWSYNEANQAVNCSSAGSGELQSLGVNLEAGKTYRVSFKFYAGALLYGIIEQTEQFELRCGLLGKNKETFFSEDAAYTDGAFITAQADYTCKETGVHQFAFYQGYSYGTLWIRNISITEVPSYDLAVTDIYGYPTMVPTSQAGSILANVVVKNDGVNDCDGVLAVTLDDNAVASVELTGMSAGKIDTIPVNLSLVSVDAGVTVNLKAAVSVAGQTDGKEENNSAMAQIWVNDKVLAYDHITEGMYIPQYTIGMQDDGKFTACVPIHLNEDDVLTGFSIGWGAVENQAIDLKVYKYNPDELLQYTDSYYGDTYSYYELGEEMYSDLALQGKEVGQIEYEIEPVELEAGDYLFCVGVVGRCLLVDLLESGELYTLSSDGSMAIEQSGLGTAAIRALLGTGGSGVDDASFGELVLQLYPNPVSETLVIRASGADIKDVSIYSVSGAQVGAVEASGSEVRYDVSGLVPGVYFARVGSSAGTEVLRFVVK